MKRLFLVVSLAVFCTVNLSAQRARPEKLEASRCHAYIGDEYIWTLEMVESGRAPTPILNIITFGEEELPLRPEQIHIYNARRRQANVDKLSIDTGEEPYVTNYLMILGGSFLGMDLEGSFSDHSEPAEVVIELGDDEFTLQPIDCLDYETLAEKINQINFNSPNIEEDFEILQISKLGSRQKRKSGRRRP